MTRMLITDTAEFIRFHLAMLLLADVPRCRRVF